MNSRFPIYQALLKLYPKAYRNKYGQPMVEMLDDVIGERPSAWQRSKVELRACLDLPRHIASQNVLAMEHNFAYDTPKIVQISSLLALLLLLPFLVNFVGNFISEASHLPLEHTWIWSKPLLVTWGLILPALAFLIALFSTARLAFKRRLTFSRIWPSLAVGVAGLTIITVVLVHFSSSCFIKNSLGLHQTLQCVSQGLNGDKDGQS